MTKFSPSVWYISNLLVIVICICTIPTMTLAGSKEGVRYPQHNLKTASSKERCYVFLNWFLVKFCPMMVHCIDKMFLLPFPDKWSASLRIIDSSQNLKNLVGALLAKFGQQQKQKDIFRPPFPPNSNKKLISKYLFFLIKKFFLLKIVRCYENMY